MLLPLKPLVAALALTGTTSTVTAAPLFDSVTTFLSHLTNPPNAAQHLDLQTPGADPTGLNTLSTLGSSAKSVLQKNQAYLLLINATPFTLRRTGGHSYQMPVWDASFPEVVQPGESIRIKIEAKTHKDDAAEMRYVIEELKNQGQGQGGEIEFQYRGHSGPLLQVEWKSLASLNNPIGSVRALTWHQGNNIPFVLSAAPSSLNTSSHNLNPNQPGFSFDPSKHLIAFPGSLPTSSWMKTSYSRLHCLTLRQLSLPGTHNSGMSLLTGGTPLVKALPASVQCHSSSMTVGSQLASGARWFDIRPVIAGGKWATGHYTFFNGIKLPSGLEQIPGLGDLAKEIGALGGGDKDRALDGWQGGNGQLLSSIISEINTFTAQNPGELIVINLSHGLNTDTFSGSGNSNAQAHLSQQEWDNLMTELLKLTNRATHLTLPNIDLSYLPLSALLPPLDPSLPLNSTTPLRASTVLIVVDDITSSSSSSSTNTLTRVNTSPFAPQGIFFRRQLSIFDSYANTNSLPAMMSDQLSKMQQHSQKKQNDDDDMDMFLLSWTLTQPVETMVTGSIVQYAEEANRALGEKLWAGGQMGKEGRYPNVVSVDAFGADGEVTGLVAGINWFLAEECPAL
ncbi:PLC-like phosphodiesterase [Pseudoneurospora amorphoporcata]|uniref:PLC-like phosphodiesterase n=1 Tax=Pseudoneurospora amorphoporcata TaxID=241081 RepID=A0AAN6NK79_9PEZI|nr:PLC-like phosphodiesterase [Pseudoneurospora amorphoporcata]